MTIKSERRLRNFGFWSGALDRVNLLTCDELDEIENQLEELYPDGLTETDLNDLFWFDFDFICELIGTTEDEVFTRE